MKGSRLMKLYLFLCMTGCLIWSNAAESYADLMFRAEKLTEQRYGKNSRAYRIRIAELDKIMESGDTVLAKKFNLKQYIKELEEAPRIRIGKVSSAADVPQQKTPEKIPVKTPEQPKKQPLSPEQILAQLHKKAAQGDPQAQFALAGHYERLFNDAERIKYLRKAAANKHPEANFLLGQLYMEGNKVPRAYDLAFRYLLQAERSSVKAAKPYLAWCYLEGKGTLKEPGKALKIYEELYKEGNHKAGLPLGNFYFEGKTVPRDYAKAVRYLESALQAKNQSLPGNFLLYAVLGKILYHGGYGVKRDPVRAYTMLKKASVEQDAESFYLLGKMYLNGEGNVRKDAGTAFTCFRQADSLGYIPACSMLGKMYHKGLGTEKDPVFAERYLKTAASHGDPESMSLFAEMLYAKKGSEKEDKTALHYFRLLAEKGDRSALCRCGEMLLAGRGTEKNLKEAARYFKRAAEKGHPDGLYFCGMQAWKNGNRKEAFSYLRTAADNGHRDAVHFVADLLLGTVPSSGEIPADLPLGITYLQKLADAGDRQAREKVASFLHRGSAGKLNRDVKKAQHYYRLAAGQNSLSACRNLAKIAYGKKDYKQAYFWAQKALSLGKDPESSAIIGTMYYHGEGRKKDPEKALHYLLEDARRGNKDSIDKVGRIYYHAGKLPEAEKYLLQAATANNAEILYMLGRINYLGIRSGPDYPKALDLLLAASEKGNVDAMLLIGRMYYRGEGMTQDFARARMYFRKAADLDSAEGMYLMGATYYNGEGVSPDYLEAMNWFKKAAQKDHVVAIQQIAIMYKEGIGVVKNNQESIRWRKRLQKGRR